MNAFEPIVAKDRKTGIAIRFIRQWRPEHDALMLDRFDAVLAMPWLEVSWRWAFRGGGCE